MSTAHVTRRRLSIGVPSFTTSSSVPRAPCSPITNDHPHPHVHTATKPPTAGSKTGALKKIRSFTSLLRPPSRSASPAPPKPKKEKRSVEGDADIAAAYGSSFMLDGGTTARNIERVHKARAKANGTYYSHGVESGAVRGPNGELFANAQEESERRGLVNGGYTRSRSKKHSQRHEEDEYATPDEEEPAWARFQPPRLCPCPVARKRLDVIALPCPHPCPRRHTMPLLHASSHGRRPLYNETTAPWRPTMTRYSRPDAPFLTLHALNANTLVPHIIQPTTTSPRNSTHRTYPTHTLPEKRPSQHCYPRFLIHLLYQPTLPRMSINHFNFTHPYHDVACLAIFSLLWIEPWNITEDVLRPLVTKPLIFLVRSE
ncbi:hypothetical protein EXIGLDRAFT_95330 [Exidia glandulosa HHB12029]|uniref:Uncharacterized protein n=1 Tax=Exidia glandulosa HHB12029 TaxID=1314781 RepID=A0A166AG56_EXIGL|nr:hypothetical protein EXIGLDRAFT_95330 [Exidia glandulosa HHB12029]